MKKVFVLEANLQKWLRKESRDTVKALLSRPTETYFVSTKHCLAINASLATCWKEISPEGLMLLLRKFQLKKYSLSFWIDINRQP